MRHIFAILLLTALLVFESGFIAPSYAQAIGASVGIRVEPVPIVSLGIIPHPSAELEALWLPAMDIAEYSLAGPASSGALGARMSARLNRSEDRVSLISVSGQMFYTPERLRVATFTYGREKRLGKSRWTSSVHGGAAYLRHLLPGGGFFYPKGAVLPVFGASLRLRITGETP